MLAIPSLGIWDDYGQLQRSNIYLANVCILHRQDIKDPMLGDNFRHSNGQELPAGVLPLQHLSTAVVCRLKIHQDATSDAQVREAIHYGKGQHSRFACSHNSFESQGVSHVILHSII